MINYLFEFFTLLLPFRHWTNFLSNAQYPAQKAHNFKPATDLSFFFDGWNTKLLNGRIKQMPLFDKIDSMAREDEFFKYLSDICNTWLINYI